MSGVSDSQNCTHCEGNDTLMIYDDWKPHNSSSGECINCGFAYYTKPYQMDLEEVNEMRVDRELEPLKKLAKSTFEGSD